MEKVGRQTILAELVTAHPVASSVLFEHGFHCIGCGMATYETLEEGARAHGYDDTAIDSLINEIQQAISDDAKIRKKIKMADLAPTGLVIKPIYPDEAELDAAEKKEWASAGFSNKSAGMKKAKKAEKKPMKKGKKKK